MDAHPGRRRTAPGRCPRPVAAPLPHVAQSSQAHRRARTGDRACRARKGAAWVLDGLSITIASSVTSKLTQPDTLNLSTAQAASIGTLYLVGEVIGALVFGRMSDTLGRRKLFTWTLAVYLVGTGLTALTPRGSGWIIYLFATRFIAGTV